MNLLEGRAAIVTGAALGKRAALGADIARSLAEPGASIVAVDMEDADSLANEICSAGGDTIALDADVTDEKQVQAMVAGALEKFGRIDILVNTPPLDPAFRHDRSPS